MELLPDQKNARLTAILLLVITLILVYLLVFHWFFMRHREYAGDLSGLRDQLGRYEAVAAMRGPVEERLQEIRSTRVDAGLFLAEADFNEAAAAMSDRLGQMVRAVAEAGCQIVSRQPVRPRVEERYQRVTVNVRMRCQPADLLEILHRLESELPMFLVDELNIVRPRARRRSARNAEVSGIDPLDIRFNMSGYLK